MEQNELTHHGIMGMKWGIRRYQNADGTLTAEGKARYGSADNIPKSSLQLKQEAARAVVDNPNSYNNKGKLTFEAKKAYRGEASKIDKLMRTKTTDLHPSDELAQKVRAMAAVTNITLDGVLAGISFTIGGPVAAATTLSRLLAMDAAYGLISPRVHNNSILRAEQHQNASNKK